MKFFTSSMKFPVSGKNGLEKAFEDEIFKIKIYYILIVFLKIVY